MKQYLNFAQTNNNFSFKHGFDLIFKKIEATLFILLSIGFLLVSNNSRDFNKTVSAVFTQISLPVVKFAALPFNTVISLLTDFSELANAKKENEILREDLRRMQSLYVKSLHIHQENQELQRVLNFVTSKSSDFNIAKIIGRTNQIFNQDLFLDIGEEKGIKEGSIVTGNRAVIGRISDIYYKRSRLIMVNDANSRIPIIISRTRTRGVLAGDGSSLMQLLYLPKNHKVKEGDWVFTSGDGDGLPPGLLIGVVKKVKKDYVGVVMAENINDIDIVTVIKY